MKNLKQGKYFNMQLKLLVNKDAQAQRMSRLSSELSFAQQRVSKLECEESRMISQLQQSINDHSMVLDRSMSSNLEDLKWIAKIRTTRSLSQDWKY